MTHARYEVKRFGSPVAEPAISVVVVTHKAGSELFDCLDSLREQDYLDYETLLVDNGDLERRRLLGYDTYYLALEKNHGPSYARNVGVDLAKGSIVAFLDDDAIADEHWLCRIVARFSDPHIEAVRGRILPKRRHGVYNLVAFHYDLGDKVIPWFLDVEGNSAVRKGAFIEANGFDSALFGEEGADLSRRLDDDRGGRIVYDPSILAYHNYADGLGHFLAKNYRHGRNEASQRRNVEGLESYQARFHETRDETHSTKGAGQRTRTRVRRVLTRLSGDRDRPTRNRRKGMITLALYGLALFSYQSGKLMSSLRNPLLRKQIS
jgi:glycosyltransferase involved in cell wall biosynthesis